MPTSDEDETQRERERERERKEQEASVLMQRLSYLTETVLYNKITRNRIVLSFKDSPRKPLGRQPREKDRRKTFYASSSENKNFPLSEQSRCSDGGLCSYGLIFNV